MGDDGPPSSSSKSKRKFFFKDESLHLVCEWQDCSETHTEMKRFMAHIEAHVHTLQPIDTGPEDSNLEMRYRCLWELCDEAAADFTMLLKHVYFHAYHSKLKSLGNNEITRLDDPSLICKLSRSTRNLIPTVQDEIKCDWADCHLLFYNIELFFRHVESHTDECSRGKNPYDGAKCRWQDCQALSQNFHKLKEHLRSHTQEKMAACSQCGATFANRTKLKDHFRRQISTEKQEYQCSHCARTYATENLLRDHMRNHVNHYRCSNCGMTTPTPSAMKQHMKYRHSDHRPFNCHVCNCSFKTESDVFKHAKVAHSSPERKAARFTCKIDNCDFSANSRSAVKEHRLERHKDKTKKVFACHLCESRFSSGANLTLHLLKEHNVKWPAGHQRFRYQKQEDGLHRLLTIRYESRELREFLMQEEEQQVEVQESELIEENEESIPDCDYRAQLQSA